MHYMTSMTFNFKETNHVQNQYVILAEQQLLVLAKIILSVSII